MGTVNTTGSTHNGRQVARQALRVLDVAVSVAVADAQRRNRANELSQCILVGACCRAYRPPPVTTHGRDFAASLRIARRAYVQVIAITMASVTYPSRWARNAALFRSTWGRGKRGKRTDPLQRRGIRARRHLHEYERFRQCFGCLWAAGRPDGEAIAPSRVACLASYLVPIWRRAWCHAWYLRQVATNGTGQPCRGGTGRLQHTP
ncbi:hypothetical protein FH972_026642 [Carpinus fangiana]|uniref:Uncharacterized protein n=1 Tax=Carpinus fangiana TaxID=176857 RepID=A0A5N6L4P5_9ROSI|nr:hypothetical protein FH972_026642 [Carpinus fangiana]